MATLSGSVRPTLGDASNIILNQRIVAYADVLSEMNPIARHALFWPATGSFSHQHVQLLTEPTVGWRNLNAGVATSQGTTKPINAPILILESWSDIDERIVEHAPQPEALRLSYARRHLSAMMKEFENAFFYGDHATNPEQPDGLKTRYNTGTLANVIDNGNTGDSATNSSIYIVEWDNEEGAYLAYAEGTPLGLERVDHGKQRITESSNPLVVYSEQFKMAIALAVADDRGVQRICNIDTVSGIANDLNPNNVILALSKMKNPESANKAAYMTRAVWVQATIEANAKQNAYYMADSPWGDGFVPFILNCPLYLAEGIIDAEDEVDP